MAAALLFATGAPALWRMDCLLCKGSELTWGDAEGCRGPNKAHDTPAIEFDCCRFTVSQGDVSEFNRIAAASVPASVEQPVEFPCYDFRSTFLEQPGVLAVAHAPPPRPSSEVVVALRCLRV